MPGPTTQHLNEDLKDLKEEVHKIAIGLAELRTEVKLLTGIAKWGVGVVVTLVVFGLSSLAGAVWWASGVDQNMKRLDSRVEHIQTTLDRRETALKTEIRKVTPEVREAIHEELKPVPKQ